MTSDRSVRPNLFLVISSAKNYLRIKQTLFCGAGAFYCFCFACIKVMWYKGNITAWSLVKTKVHYVFSTNPMVTSALSQVHIECIKLSGATLTGPIFYQGLMPEKVFLLPRAHNAALGPHRQRLSCRKAQCGAAMAAIISKQMSACIVSAASDLTQRGSCILGCSSTYKLAVWDVWST